MLEMKQMMEGQQQQIERLTEENEDIKSKLIHGQ
jgi:hypothetical protein